MKEISIEEKSSAATLSDMEIFIFPDLMQALLLANILSPRLWRWRELDKFKDIRKMLPKRRMQKLRQHIMDSYTFNLDLDTWGLTNQQRELARFSSFMSPDAIAASNALFGYHGDAYYYDIDIRRHFGLDKYGSDTIPYWKTETIEAMDAFKYKEGHSCGAGECVSLAGLYAAACFVVAGIELKDIYMMATPLHSQNYINVAGGILTNNRRLVTQAMWSNGTVISQQARRALEHERVTIVSHETGYIHLLYPEATISTAAYKAFSSGLEAFLRPPPGSADMRLVVPRLPKTEDRVFTQESCGYGITCDMSYSETAGILRELQKSNRAAALAPYAGHELGATESGPFMKAAMERSPVSANALRGLSESEIVSRLEAMPGDSIYDGVSRTAQPDEVWNFGRGDGLEKCILAANVFQGGEVIVDDAKASFVKDGREVCSFPTVKRPKDRILSKV